MNEQNLLLAAKLKELGVREFGAPVWQKQSETPDFAGITAEVQKNPVVNSGKTVILYSLKIDKPEGGFYSIRLAKGVQPNKAAFDVYFYKAVRNFPDTEADRKRFPNVTPIKIGDVCAMAH